MARAKGRLERASGCATVLEAMLPLLVTSRTLQTMLLVTFENFGADDFIVKYSESCEVIETSNSTEMSLDITWGSIA